MFGWPSGPSSGSYRSETLPPSPSHPEGAESGRNETPSSMDEAAGGHAPAPLQRGTQTKTSALCMRRASGIH